MPGAEQTMTLDRRGDTRLVAHPLAQHALANLRDVGTDSPAFRHELTRLGRVCGFALAGEYVDTDSVEVQTPLTTTTGQRVTDDVVFVAILRAAVPFVEGLVDAVPRARQGVLSASRDEAAGRNEDGQFPITVRYVNLPEIRPSDTVVVADPMLATGSTMVAALDAVLDGVSPATAVALSAVSAPEGIDRVADRFPDVELVTAGIDDRLDENGFIVPGLGDAGDRAFGTSE
jgi:uracil phosphoribosyltransferase